MNYNEYNPSPVTLFSSNMYAMEDYIMCKRHMQLEISFQI